MGNYPVNAFRMHIDSQINKGTFCYSDFGDICNDDLVKEKVLSRIFFWSERMDHSEFYKTDAELAQECKMKMTRFKSAKKQLIDLGFIEVTLKGVPAKTHYTLKIDNIMNAIYVVENNASLSDPLVNWSNSDQLNKTQHVVIQHTEESQISRNPTNNSNGDRNSTNMTIGIRPTNTKNTTKNTKKENIYKKKKDKKVEGEEILFAGEKENKKQEVVEMEEKKKNYEEKEAPVVSEICTKEQDPVTTEEKEVEKRKKISGLLPEGFTAPEYWIQDFITEYGASEEFARESAISFINYHIGKETMFGDWEPIWRTWMRNGKNNPRFEKHFSKASTIGSSLTPEKSSLSALKEKIGYRQRVGIDKLICDEIKRVFGENIFLIWIETNNVSFHQPKEGAKVECKTPSFFIRDYVENKILSPLGLGYLYTSIVDPSIANRPKSLPKEPNWLNAKIKDIAKLYSPKCYTLLAEHNIQFSETDRKGMLKMYGCSQDVWDKVYNLLCPITQDYLELKIGEGRPN